MSTIQANELKFKTFDYLKVNETTVEIPAIFTQDFNLPSDKFVKIDEFKDDEYGVSKEALEINEEFGNYYRYINSNENKKKEIIRLETTDLNTELFDTIDIVTEKGESQEVIIDYSSKGHKEKFRNSIIRILGHEDSKTNVFIIQREGEESTVLESILVHGEEGANVSVNQYEVGSSKLISNYKANLIGEASHAEVNSIYFGYNEHEIDLIYNIIHEGKDSTSNIIINGALKDNARKIFKSNLDFKEGSTGSVGNEEEFCILLDSTVKSVSVPLLLCHEDDVLGNHAASAGRIDENILFYIMSRGFSMAEAEKLIIESRFAGAIDELQDDNLKEEIWNRVLEYSRKDVNE